MFLVQQILLAKTLTSNFDLILGTFSPDVYSDPKFGRFTDWLSILSVKHNVKFYPPVSMSCFFHDFKLSDAALRSVMLPSVTKSFPRKVILDPEEDGELEGREIPWEELTWDLFFGYCGSMLGHKRTDDPSAKSGDGFVFKRFLDSTESTMFPLTIFSRGICW